MRHPCWETFVPGYEPRHALLHPTSQHLPTSAIDARRFPHMPLFALSRPGKHTATVTIMGLVALVGLRDSRGWLLLQERDEHARVDPNK